MTEGKKNKNLAIRVSEKRRWELKKLAATHHIEDNQELVERALALLEQKLDADEGRPSTFTRLGENPEYYFSEVGLQSESDRQLYVKLAEAIRSGGPDARRAIAADLDKYVGKALRHPKTRTQIQALDPDELGGEVDELERDTTAVERDLRKMAGGKPGATGGGSGVGTPSRKRNPPKAG